jgi:hypothetical protein
MFFNINNIKSLLQIRKYSCNTLFLNWPFENQAIFKYAPQNKYSFPNLGKSLQV